MSGFAARRFPLATDPLREEIAVILASFPELKEMKLDPAEYSFVVRRMAQAYRLGVEHTLIRITPKVGRA